MAVAETAVSPNKDAFAGGGGSIRILRIVAAMGFGIFGIAFVIAFWFPGALETRAREFVIERVLVEIDGGLAGAASSAAVLGPVGARITSAADSLRASLREDLRPEIASALWRFCEFNCGDSSAPIQAIDADSPAGLLTVTAARATELAQARYSERVRALVRDLRIFSGVNALLFLLILGAAVVAPAPGRGTLRLLWILLSATGISILGYVFLQDWLHAILYSEFVGWAYLAWVACVSVVLIDWGFNRGRGSQAFVDALSGAVSATY